MDHIKVKEKNNEVHVSLHNGGGISVESLYKYLGKLMEKNPDIKQSPVALCLSGVDTNTTLITKAENEGDNSTLWLSVRHNTEKILLKGFELT